MLNDQEREAVRASSALYLKLDAQLTREGEVLAALARAQATSVETCDELLAMLPSCYARYVVREIREGLVRGKR